MPSQNIKQIGLITILSLSSTAYAQTTTRSRRSSPARIIAGVVVAVVVVLLLLAVCCCLMLRRRRAARAGMNGPVTPGRRPFGFGRPGGGMFGAKGNQGNGPLTGATGGAMGAGHNGFGHTGAASQNPGYANGNIAQPPPAYGKEGAVQNGGYQPPTNFPGQTGMNQGGFAPPSGAPPPTQGQNNNFVGGFK